MKIEVLLSSGETDSWDNAASAVILDAYLHVLYHIPGDEIPEWMKVYEVVEEIPQPAMRPMVKTTPYQLVSVYAPGMWMKVEYLRD